MLTNHTTTEDEKYQICEWEYEGDYAIYNMGSYEEMRKNHFGLANPRMYVESFYDHNKLVGFCNLFDDGDEVFFGIGVNPNLCGKGYGVQMIEKMYVISKEMFPEKPLYLEVRTWNKRAIDCYKRAGFIIDGDIIHQNTYAGEGTFYRMIKK